MNAVAGGSNNVINKILHDCTGTFVTIDDPDYNPLDDCMWDAVEKKVDTNSHNTKHIFTSGGNYPRNYPCGYGTSLKSIRFFRLTIMQPLKSRVETPVV